MVCDPSAGKEASPRGLFRCVVAGGPAVREWCSDLTLGPTAAETLLVYLKVTDGPEFRPCLCHVDGGLHIAEA